MTQRDKMRELFRFHQGNKAAVISAYAEAEKAGEVDRLRNASGHGTEQYARALWADGEKKGWLTQSKTSPSDKAKYAPPPHRPPSTGGPHIPPDPIAHLMAFRENLQTLKKARDDFEHTISQMESLYEVAALNQPRLVESYIDSVRTWLPEWDRLEAASQVFLPHAELLFDGALKGNNQDFSPFIIQYCRALENEFLNKLFSAYTDDVRARHVDDLDDFLANALADDKTARFAKMIKRGDKKYTLGDMRFILNFLDVNGRTFLRVELLSDFRAFVLNNFGEDVLAQSYLDQINRITSDFRNLAAHPNLIGRDVAEECRSLIRECLNVFILSYHGPHTLPIREMLSSD